MPDNQFKYIINATLKLNTGSLTTLVTQIKDMDKEIRSEFNKQGTSVKVPLTADQNIEQLRKGVNRIIESYNKGQAPSIKLAVVPDEASISKLQSRISELKKELNSLSDEKSRISVNTSLVVGRGEADEVQKQVDGIKPVVEVKLVANDDSIKELQAKVEAIKAQVEARVKTIQDYNQGDNVFGRTSRNSVGNISRNTVSRIKNRPQSTQTPRANDVYRQESKAIKSDISSMQGNLKLLQDQLKLELSADEIQKRIDGIKTAREKGSDYYHAKDSKGKFIKGGRTNASEYDSQVKDLESELESMRKVEALQKQIGDKEKSLSRMQDNVVTNKSKRKITQWNDTQLPSPSLVSSETRRQQIRRFNRDRNRVSDVNNAFDMAWEANNSVGRVTDPVRAQKQAIEDHKRWLSSQPSFNDKYVDLVTKRNTAQSKIEDVTGLVNSKEKRAQYSPEQLTSFTNELNKLRGEFSDLQKQVDEERAKVQTQMLKQNSSSKEGSRLNDSLFNSIGNSSTDHNSKVKNWLDEQEKQVQEELEKQWTMQGAFSPLPANGKIAKKIYRNNTRQQAQQSKDYLQSQNNAESKLDYDTHIRRYGGNREYSASSMIDALKDPNVSLADSKKILEQINKYQASQSRANGMNFQRSYAIKWTDESGHLQEANTLVYQYTKLGEVVAKGDKGIVSMFDHIAQKAGLFSILEMGVVGFMAVIGESITELVKFDQQLAEIQSTTQNLTQQGTLKSFYKPAGGESQLQTTIQSNAFDIGKQFGVDTLNTVMPIEQAVIARPDLISNGNGTKSKYDASKQNEIVKNIMQFSAISTGGKEDEETVNELTNDLTSLYQANQKVSPKGYMGKMKNMLDYLSAMHSYGVNTTGITNAMAELAPETLQQGVNSNQAMAMMGAFSLSNAGGSQEDVENIGKTFYNSIMHANTNSHLKDTLSQYLGINLDANPMKAPDLINEIIKNYHKVDGNEGAEQALAMALSTSGGGGQQSKSMTPLMVKFLQGSQSQFFNDFTKKGKNGSTEGAMDNAWIPYSKTLQTNINRLVQSFKELVQLMGQLGATSTFGLMLKGVTGVLNAVDGVLIGFQKMSAFFQDHHIFDFSKFTVGALGFLGTMKLIQKFFNKRDWGGYVGSALSHTNPWGFSYGIKQNPADAIGGVGTVATRTGSALATEASMMAPAMLPLGPAQKSVPLINPQEISQAEKALATKNANAILTDIMAVSNTVPLMNKSMPSSLSEINGVNMPSQPRGLSQNIARTAEYDAMSTGRKAFSATGVGNFMSEAMLVGQIRGGALSGGGTRFIEGLTSGFKSLLPIIMDFGILLTRLTVIGGALFLAFEGVKLVADQIAKDKASQKQQTQNNLVSLQKQAQKDPEVAKKIQSNVADLISYSKSGQHELASNPLEIKYGVRTNAQNKGEANIDYLKQYGIQYHKSLLGNKDYITYMSQDANNKWKKQTYHIGDSNKDKSEEKKFNDFLDNGAVSSTKKIADAWKINTSYLGDYSNQLKVVNTLTQNLSESMKTVDSAVKGVDATFGGINSSSALQKKISITQKGINGTTHQIGQISASMDSMGNDKNHLNNQYNDQKNKIIGSGESASAISDMESNTLIARANGNNPQAIADSYKKDPKLYDLAKAFNTLQDFTTAFNGSQDQFLSLKDQYNQMLEQQKQYQAQLVVTKLGIDAMNASLTNLGTVASASKALVDISANTLNTGDNSTQIHALSTDMGVSTAQMNNMVGQKNVMQQKMSQIVKENPSQDFSLNALYNPSGEVSAQQMAYKTLYEQSQQMTQNISNQSSSMYQQLSQLKDLVLNSNAYADSWERVQQTVQDVKDAIKEANDFQYQMSSVNENAVTEAGVTGQSVFDIKGQQLQSMRDNALQINTKLTTDGKSAGNDVSKLNQAWKDILQAEGQNFQNAMINPLKDIVKGFNSSDSAFGSSVNSFGTAVKNFGNIISQENADANIAQSAKDSGSPTPSSSNYNPSSTTGAMTDTGRTIKNGYQDQDYGQSLGSIVGGIYAQSDSKGMDNQQKFVYAGSKYNVDPNLLASIAMAENSGNSSLLKATNNVGSIKAGGSWHGATYRTSTGTYRKYSSLQAGIDDLAKLIAGKIAKGDNTIPKLNADYAQSPDWMKAVAYFMAKATNTTTKTWLGNATTSDGYHLSGNDGGDPNYKGNGSSSSSNSFSKGTKVTTTNDLWLHKSATTSSSSRVKVLPKGSTYTSYGESNGMVNLGNGWVSASYLKGSSGGSSSSLGGNGGVSAMTNWYNSVLGNTSKMKYSWGGAHVMEDWTTFLKKGIADCSGLVEQVYRRFAGIDLGKTTSQGIYNESNGNGVKVTNKKDLQEGDLVFFGSSASKITHVGVYAGNNQMYTINDKGQPVKKQAMWSNYVGGKHYNIATGTNPSNPASGATTPFQRLQGETSGYHDSVTAEKSVLSNNIDALKSKIFDNIGQAIINGNIADIMGTSGVTGKYDAIKQSREDIGTQMIANHHQMTQLNTKHDSIVSRMNTASKNKDTASYDLLKQQLDDNNSLIKALQENTKTLQSLDAKYKAQQDLDPRLNGSTAHDAIVGGINQLSTYNKNGQTGSTDFYRVVNEVNTMKSEYQDHTKQTQSLQTLFGNYGVQAQALTLSQSRSDQDNINLIVSKIKNITGVLKQFAQGTEQWYSALTNAVQAEQQLHDLEQKRMTDAQTMFQLTGQGVQGYVQQRAYVQSKDYVQNSKNLSTALTQYQNGTMNNGYGVQTGGYKKQADAQKVADYIKDKYGINAVVKDGGKGSKYRYSVNTANNLTSDQADSVNSDLKKSKKAKSSHKTGGGSTAEDFNQQLANLQIIADAHNSMTQQMNDYRQAVVDGFKAGAMSIDEYMAKMNQLRDKETEAKEQATTMISSIQNGFQSALSDAISNGLQGAMNSPMDFMNNIKTTIASSISGQLATTLLQNTGLQDVMNKITSQITSASTSGDPNAIVNMFNNNDMGKELQDALAPFIPMIQQIVGSAQGIFTILKDQVYNAPSAFKIDSYMNEIANKVGYQGIKTMNPDVDSAGAPNGGSGNSGTIQTSGNSGSQGNTNSQSSGGTKANGGAENTGGKSSGAQGSGTYTSTDGSNKKPNKSGGSTTSTGKAMAKTTADVHLRKGPSTSYGIIKTLKKGTSWDVLGHKNGWLELGTNEWADESYFTGNFGPNLGGSSSSGGSKSSSSKTKHTSSALNLRSSAGYGSNVELTIPKGASVDYMGLVNGWAHVSYKGKTGYVGSSYLYHTGGIAGITNFASAQGLKPNELSAILQKSETIFQPKQLDDLVSGAMQAGSNSNNGGGLNLTVNINIDGGGNYDQKGIEAVVETAVSKAMSQFSKTTRLNNLSWKGTSY